MPSRTLLPVATAGTDRLIVASKSRCTSGIRMVRIAFVAVATCVAVEPVALYVEGLPPAHVCPESAVPSPPDTVRLNVSEIHGSVSVRTLTYMGVPASTYGHQSEPGWWAVNSPSSLSSCTAAVLVPDDAAPTTTPVLTVIGVRISRSVRSVKVHVSGDALRSAPNAAATVISRSLSGNSATAPPQGEQVPWRQRVSAAVTSELYSTVIMRASSSKNRLPVALVFQPSSSDF